MHWGDNRHYAALTPCALGFFSGIFAAEAIPKDMPVIVYTGKVGEIIYHISIEGGKRGFTSYHLQLFSPGV